MKLKTGILLTAAFAGCLATSHGQTSTWTGASSVQWGLAANWTSLAVPSSSTDIEFANIHASTPTTNNTVRDARDVAFTRTSGNMILTLDAAGGLNARGTISTISGGSEVFLRSGGSLSAANLTINNSLNLGSRSASGVTGSIGSVAISGTTTVNSSGILQAAGLAGTTNLGSLAMNGGALYLVAGNAAANGTADGATNTITVSRLNGSTGTITGAKTGATTTTTGHLIVSGSINGTYAGTISNGLTNNLVQLTKSGSSTLTLSGSNSYTGATSVTAGTLVIAGSLGNTAVDVGGTGILAGSGTIGGAVTVNSGGQIAAGTSPGRLTVNNSVTVANGGAAGFELTGATVASQYDQILMSGGASVFSLTSTNNLVLSLTYTPAANALFFLVDNQGSSAISGVFEELNGVTTSLVQNAVFTLSGQQFQISYVGDVSTNSMTGGNDLVLQAVPEPGTWTLLAGGLTVLMVMRRRAR